MDTQPTNQEILEAIQTFSTHVDKEFRRVDERFQRVDGLFADVKGYIDRRLESVEKQMRGLETRVVTKDYLDEKLADLKGDLVILMRKEDRKVTTIVDVLLERKLISREDAKRILSMDLFPQSV